jgi:hypothetical protein
MIIAYHEIQRHKLPSVQTRGLRRRETSDKYSREIKRTNQFLDTHRAPEQAARGLSRMNAVYCYLAQDGKLVDITSGMLVEPERVITDKDHLLLQLTVDPSKCYVSDLDLYDQAKEAIEKQNSKKAAALGARYWQALYPYVAYRPGLMKRPELIVSYDIPAEDIIKVYTLAGQ